MLVSDDSKQSPALRLRHSLLRRGLIDFGSSGFALGMLVFFRRNENDEVGALLEDAVADGDAMALWIATSAVSTARGRRRMLFSWQPLATLSTSEVDAEGVAEDSSPPTASRARDVPLAVVGPPEMVGGVIDC